MGHTWPVAVGQVCLASQFTNAAWLFCDTVALYVLSGFLLCASVNSFPYASLHICPIYSFNTCEFRTCHVSKTFLGPEATAAVRAGKVSSALVDLTLFGSACFQAGGRDPGEVRRLTCKSKALKQGRGGGIGAPGEGVAFHRIRLSALMLTGWKPDSEMLQI